MLLCESVVKRWTCFLSHVRYSRIIWLQSIKMKAGCSQLKPVVLILILNSCFYASYELTGLQVRLESGDISAGVFTTIHECRIVSIIISRRRLFWWIYSSCRWERGWVGVFLYITLILTSYRLVIAGMWALQRYSLEWHRGGSALLLVRWSDRRALLLEKWQHKRPWTHHRVGY